MICIKRLILYVGFDTQLLNFSLLPTVESTVPQHFEVINIKLQKET